MPSHLKMISYLKSFIWSKQQDSNIENIHNVLLPNVIPFLELSHLRKSIFFVCKRWREEVRSSLEIMDFEAPEEWWMEYIQYHNEYQRRYMQWKQDLLRENMHTFSIDGRQKSFQQALLSNLTMDYNKFKYETSSTQSIDPNISVSPPKWDFKWKPKYHIPKKRFGLTIFDEKLVPVLSHPDDILFVMREAKKLNKLSINFKLTMDIVQQLNLFKHLEKIEYMKIDYHAQIDLKFIFHLFKKVRISSIDIYGGKMIWNNPISNVATDKNIEFLPFVGLNVLKCGSYWDHTNPWYSDPHLVQFAATLLKQQSMKEIRILDFPQFSFKKMLTCELANQPFCEELIIYVRKDEIYDYQKMMMASNPDNKHILEISDPSKSQDYVPTLKLISKEFEFSSTTNLKIFKYSIPLGVINKKMIQYIQSLTYLENLSIACKETQFDKKIMLRPLPELTTISIENCFHFIDLACDELEYIYLSLDINGQPNIFDVNTITRFYCISQLNIGLKDSAPRRWSSEQLQLDTYADALFMVENFIMSNPISQLSLIVEDKILARNCNFFEILCDCIDLVEVYIDVVQTPTFSLQDAQLIEMRLKGILPNVFYFAINYKYLTIQQAAWLVMLLPNVQEFQFNEFDSRDEDEGDRGKDWKNTNLFKSFSDVKQKYQTFTCPKLFQQFIEDMLLEIRAAISKEDFEEIQMYIQDQVIQEIEEDESFEYFNLPPGYETLYYCFEILFEQYQSPEYVYQEEVSNSDTDPYMSEEDMWELMEDSQSF